MFDLNGTDLDDVRLPNLRIVYMFKFPDNYVFKFVYPDGTTSYAVCKNAEQFDFMLADRLTDHFMGVV